MWCFLTCRQVHEEHIAEALPGDRNLEVMRLLCPLRDNCLQSLDYVDLQFDRKLSCHWRADRIQCGLSVTDNTGGKRLQTSHLPPQVLALMNIHAIRNELCGSARLHHPLPLQTVPTDAGVFGASVSQKCLILAAPTLLSFAHSCDRAKSPWMCAQHAARYFQGCHRFPWASRTTACRLTWLPERPKCDSWMMCQ